MKKILVLTLLALMIAVAGTVVAQGAEHKDKGSLTVRGEVLDMACYVAQGAMGAEHAACAKRCAKGGQPIGLRTEDGTVYLLYASHENADAFKQAQESAGSTVEIKGKAASRDGIKGLEVHKVQAP